MILEQKFIHTEKHKHKPLSHTAIMQKTSSKWIIDLNANAQIIKFLKKTQGNIFAILGQAEFLKEHRVFEPSENLDFINIKNSSKKNGKAEWERIIPI